MTFSFLGAVAHENELGAFYHGFNINGRVFSALRCCRFKDPVSKEIFFGRIHACYKEKQSNSNMMELQVFLPVPEDQKRCTLVEYTELYGVLNETMDIPIECILDEDVQAYSTGQTYYNAIFAYKFLLSIGMTPPASFMRDQKCCSSEK